ncbi:hypothetical protein CR203_09180 [Salipaludibacillus neizhouensis]|uniref:LysM domain-containing protein n=1 Tax=Salipaludibacillus neizhouensis TaxID=885475 RepID=A0A3A9KAM3_9BACI|nr:cell wall hydrolase [Salipaludibacillus neizhouensis]RKL67511.1 hypothetical protein CR203_09180 [Salipaludibacillus neizhouensis]
MKKFLILSILAGAIYFSVPSESFASSYKVKEGDSLYFLSQRYGISITELKNENNLLTNEIISGDYLVIPTNAKHSHTVKPGESLWSIATKYGMTIAQLQQKNYLSSFIVYPGQALAVSGKGVKISNHGFSEEERNLLARLVQSEAKGEPFKGKVAVAAVVLNRMAHKDFPFNIKEVIYETHDSGRIFAFEPVQNGEITRHADQESIRAVEEAMNGYDPTNGAVYFFNPTTSTSKWIESRVVRQRIGNHVFSF